MDCVYRMPWYRYVDTRRRDRNDNSDASAAHAYKASSGPLVHVTMYCPRVTGRRTSSISEAIATRRSVENSGTRRRLLLLAEEVGGSYIILVTLG